MLWLGLYVVSVDVNSAEESSTVGRFLDHAGGIVSGRSSRGGCRCLFIGVATEGSTIIGVLHGLFVIFHRLFFVVLHRLFVSNHEGFAGVLHRLFVVAVDGVFDRISGIACSCVADGIAGATCGGDERNRKQGGQ